MSERERPEEPTAGTDGEPLVAEPAGYAPSVAERLAVYQRAGGIVTPVLTTAIAFFIGGLVVLATGNNPLSTYRAIFNGTGLNWFFPWVGGADRVTAEFNLQQTLLTTTTLMLTGLAVAFAFRCGLFNIGGQGQYVVGTIIAVWVGSSFVDMSPFAHILLAVVLAVLAAAVWGGIAGLLKATVGAHEVITTIMLNWIAYWIGSYAFARGGPLQNEVSPSVPISSDIAEGAKLPVWWGDPVLQGLHVGFFVALGALVVFWLILSRTTLGYEVRTVGFNPEAARYGGISVGRNYVLAMAISGMFAGLAGALDILGYLFRIGVLDIQTSQIGFVGIAVALLGRNRPVGMGVAALLFGFLNGTSGILQLQEIPPEVVRIMQGIILLSAVVSYEIVRRLAEAAEIKAAAEKLERERARPEPVGASA